MNTTTRNTTTGSHSTVPGAGPPGAGRERTFRTVVRGYAFASGPPGVGPVEIGRLVRLVRELGNPADPMAVAVWVGDARGAWRLGYLDRAVAAWVGPRLGDGTEVAGRVVGFVPEPDGRWQRPVVEITAGKPVAVAAERSPRRGWQTTPAVGSATAGAGEGAVRRSPAEGGRDPGPGGLWGRPPGVARRVVGTG